MRKGVLYFCGAVVLFASLIAKEGAAAPLTAAAIILFALSMAVIDPEDREQQTKNVELEALITEREGMLAGNHERRTQGYADMYGPDHFYELAERMRAAGKEG